MAAPSIVKGPTEDPLYLKSLGELIQDQAKNHGSRPALVVPWQRFRASFEELNHSSANVAKALLDFNIKRGSHVGIFAGNRQEYINVFLAGGRIGRPVVVLNTTYTPAELCNAVTKSACKVIFISRTIGKRQFAKHIDALVDLVEQRKSALKYIVLLDNDTENAASPPPNCETWAQFLLRAQSIYMTENNFHREERGVKATDILNLQFTSGTTGQPKAAMLSHISLINNGRLNGVAMELTGSDVVCCPPPLFHCFGLVMGFLNSFFHGCSIVFPSEEYDAEAVVESLIQEKCTALLGVPTMFVAELDILKRRGVRLTAARTGLAAGAPVPERLMNRIKDEMGIGGMLIAYGMTETSPVTFMTSLNDPLHLRVTSLGRVMPHTAAKIIDPQTGKILPRGTRGELCTSGYALQKEYYDNVAKTQEVMIRDADGVLWMHTGDECLLDEAGYCFITGRLKDIIIRGGENIYPREIEDRLMLHEAIEEAAVAPIKDERYGEAVGAFLRAYSTATSRPSDQVVREWVAATLGKHKVPQHVFWIGDPGFDEFPKTGSGKLQKHILSAIGGTILANNTPKPKL